MNKELFISINEVKTLGKILEYFYNEKFEKYSEYFNHDDKLSYDNLVFKSDSSNINFVNTLMLVLDNAHTVYQEALSSSFNSYGVSINVIDKRIEMINIHLSNINSILEKVEKNFKLYDMTYISKLKAQQDNLNRALLVLRNAKDKLLNKKSIDIEKIFNINKIFVIENEFI